MHGIMTPTFTYILKCEKDLLPSEQTTWHVKILTAGDSSASIARYSKAFSTSGNKTDVNQASYKNAFRAEFVDCLKKVENYCFGEYKYPELFAKGYQIYDDPEMIGKIFEDLPENVVKEIVEVAKSEVSIGELEPKK